MQFPLYLIYNNSIICLAISLSHTAYIANPMIASSIFPRHFNSIFQRSSIVCNICYCRHNLRYLEICLQSYEIIIKHNLFVAEKCEKKKKKIGKNSTEDARNDTEMGGKKEREILRWSTLEG